MCPLAEVRGHHCIADRCFWSASGHISLALVEVAIPAHPWEARGSGHRFDGGNGGVEPVSSSTGQALSSGPKNHLQGQADLLCLLTRIPRATCQNRLYVMDSGGLGDQLLPKFLG